MPLIQTIAPEEATGELAKLYKLIEAIRGSVGNNAKTAHTIEKTMASSFVGTDLEEWLRNNGIGTVAISGYMTQHCCDTTARYAHHLDFNVEFLSDATGTLAFENGGGKATAEELHRATLVEQAFRFSTVMSTKEWIGTISIKA